MQRFLTFVVLALLTVPVGLSLQGCANKNSTYCNGAGYGYNDTQPVSISLQPQTTGLSVAFSQTTQLQSPTAQNCKGGSASVRTYTYGTSDRTIADVSPTGAVCGGTWNLHTPAVAAYTTCIPTGKTGIAYMTASASGFTSNQVAVYSHPAIASLAVDGPTNPVSKAPECLSQGLTSQLDATAYTTNSAGQQVLLCSPDILPGGGYGPTDCNNVIGHLTYAPASAGIVTIDQNGVATAQAPGSTLITGTISQTSSNAGYFYTCPPAKIALSVASTGATSASVTLNTPLALTATVTDVNNNVINGLPLSYVSTNPGSIAVNSTGAVTAAFPSNSAITAICQPTACNPAPINVMGTLGTGVPVISNFVQITSPGKNSNYIWVSSPGSPYFVPIDLSTGTIGTPIKMPYSPNSMVLDPTGTTLYFGSYHEMMSYSAVTNSLSSEQANTPGIVLAVSPNNTAGGDQRSAAGCHLSLFAIVGKLYLLRRDRSESRLHRRWPNGLRGGRRGPVYPQLLHRLVGRKPARQSGNHHLGNLPGDEYDQPHPYGSDNVPAQHDGQPQQHLQHVLFSGSCRDHSRGRGLSLRLADRRLWRVPGNDGEAGGELSTSDHRGHCL